GAQVAPADQHHLAVAARDAFSEPEDVAGHRRRRELDPTALGVDNLAQSRLEWSQIDSVDRIADLAERQPFRPAAVAVAVGSDAQEHVDDALRTDRAIRARGDFFEPEVGPVASVLQRGAGDLLEDEVVDLLRGKTG